MKKLFCLLAAAALLLTTASCGKYGEELLDIEPKVSQMKSICELATMECYYHNVAKFKEEGTGFLFWGEKGKHFWIEYSGVVTLGVDVSLVTMEIEGNKVTVTLPEAKVLGCKVDSDSLTEDSFIVAKTSGKIEAEDEIAAFDAAQSNLEETAANDKVLLASAQSRAQSLLEDYISNIGKAVGKQYSIQWVYLDSEGNELNRSETELPAQTASETLPESGESNA